MQNTAVFPWQLLFIFGCLNKDIPTWQKKAIHTCSNKSLIIDSKQTPIPKYLSVWDGLNLKTEFLKIFPVSSFRNTSYFGIPLTDSLQQASKTEVLLFEQGRHVVLGTQSRQALLSLPWGKEKHGHYYTVLDISPSRDFWKNRKQCSTQCKDKLNTPPVSCCSLKCQLKTT